MADPAQGVQERSSYHFVVDEADAGLRLDRYLATRQLPHTRSLIKKHIDAGYCRINECLARPASTVKAGDSVAYVPPPAQPLTVEPEPIALCILHEDRDLIVIDKPAGLVVHPAPGHAVGTLVAALLSHCKDLSGIGGTLRPGIVHRLDKLTSGVMVAAKTDAAHRHLAAQFKCHTIERCYQAIVVGHLTASEGTFSTMHARHPTQRKRFTTRCRYGRQAISHFRVLDRLYGATLAEVRLETGRTHQVRVHFADHGHPVLGDPVYARTPTDPRLRAVARQLERQALHASVLAFDHPTSGDRLRFVAPLPSDMRAALKALQQP